MQSTSVLTWMRNRRVIAFIVLLALALTISIGLVISGPTSVNAADDAPQAVEQLDGELVLAGTSWSWNVQGPGLPGDPGVSPIWVFGPSWG
jgi:hypothetical protein